MSKNARFQALIHSVCMYQPISWAPNYCVVETRCWASPNSSRTISAAVSIDLCSKPPSATCCTLCLARCERASLRRCAIGGARSVAYGDGARCMQAAGACGLTCLSVQRVHFWVRWGVPAEPVSFCGRRQRQQHDEGRTFWSAQTRTASAKERPKKSAPVCCCCEERWRRLQF